MTASILIYFLTILAIVVFSFSQTGPLVGNAFLFLFILLFLCYRALLNRRSRLVIFLPLILFFAHPAFLSHDVYSYAIYAKELIYYHVIPQFVPPNAFPFDPWLAFNHWPTSASRYGPVWTALSLVPFLIGSPNLLLVSYAFKILGVLGYLLNLFLFKKLSPKINFLVFALNPFIILEALASPHTDVWVTVFVLVSLIFILRKKPRLAWLSLLASVGVKIVSLSLIFPLLLQSLFRFSSKILIAVFAVFAYLGSAIIIARWSINPWYLYLPITLSLLLWEIKFWRYLAVSLSAAALVRYLPYFYLGFFDPHNKIRAFLFLITLVPLILWTFIQFRRYYRKQIA